jgi:hypothetical protein
MEMAIGLARASDEQFVSRWTIIIHNFESDSQSMNRLTIAEQGREGLVLSVEWNA